jgi:hypothetical protein
MIPQQVQTVRGPNEVRALRLRAFAIRLVQLEPNLVFDQANAGNTGCS